MVSAPPSAELEPLREGTAAQTDEQDMGMTYEVTARLKICRETTVMSGLPPREAEQVHLCQRHSK